MNDLFGNKESDTGWCSRKGRKGGARDPVALLIPV